MPKHGRTIQQFLKQQQYTRGVCYNKATGVASCGSFFETKFWFYIFRILFFFEFFEFPSICMCCGGAAAAAAAADDDDGEGGGGGDDDDDNMMIVL